jgi:restriction system protein
MDKFYDALMEPLYHRYGEQADIHGPVPAPPPTGLGAIAARLTEFSEMSKLYRKANDALQQQLLAHIYAQDHRFFENLIIDVLLSMGYGERRRDLAKHLGRSHDGGIDGMIAQDELGLDFIMLQAKRLKPGSAVSAGQVRDFAGGLEAKHASKGIFFTTTQFSQQAQRFAQSVSRRIVLINGHELTNLMIRHNIGVSVRESFVFRQLELGYFSAAAAEAIC